MISPSLSLGKYAVVLFRGFQDYFHTRFRISGINTFSRALVVTRNILLRVEAENGIMFRAK
jgi:hypothetical protein